MARTRRPATAPTIARWSCAASNTITSRSSPTSQMLFVTSHSPPSSANTPSVVTSSTVMSEDHDASEHIAALHAVERLLDAVEPDRLRDEAVEIEPALEVEIDQEGEVA